MALVSVIMPSFNSERHVGKAIESVLAQTLVDFELIVVDGGSTDQTVEVIKKISEKDDRVIYINNIDDKGPAHARFIGIKRCIGKYVAFLDADDTWLSNKLELQTRFMHEHNIDFCYTNYRTMDESGKLISCLVPIYSSYTFFQALARRGIATLTVMVNKKLLNDNIIGEYGKTHGEEYLWWLLILKQGAVAIHLNEDTARYRNTAGSLSTYRYRHLLTVWHSYRNEIGLGLFIAFLCYFSCLVDSFARKTWVVACSRLLNSAP